MLVNSCDIVMLECLKLGDQHMYDLIKEAKNDILESTYIKRDSYHHSDSFEEKVERNQICLSYNIHNAAAVEYVKAHVECLGDLAALGIDVSLIRAYKNETEADFICRTDVNHYFDYPVKRTEKYYGDYYTAIIKAICEYVYECRQSHTKIVKKRVAEHGDFNERAVSITWKLCEKYDFNADIAMLHVWEVAFGS